jgi:hypothetical protein
VWQPSRGAKRARRAGIPPQRWVPIGRAARRSPSPLPHVAARARLGRADDATIVAFAGRHGFLRVPPPSPILEAVEGQLPALMAAVLADVRSVAAPLDRWAATGGASSIPAGSVATASLVMAVAAAEDSEFSTFERSLAAAELLGPRDWEQILLALGRVRSVRGARTVDHSSGSARRRRRHSTGRTVRPIEPKARARARAKCVGAHLRRRLHGIRSRHFAEDDPWRHRPGCAAASVPVVHARDGYGLAGRRSRGRRLAGGVARGFEADVD